MKAQNLNMYVVNSQEAKQAFVDVQSDVYVKLMKAIDDMGKAGKLPRDAKEIFEYGLRVGQYMTLVEISTGLNLDKKEDEISVVIEVDGKELVKKEVVEEVINPSCDKNK
jgi:hypothetical protein